MVSDQGHSKQIDVLIVDATKPRFFEDGDLVVVGTDAVVGIIEVKTSVGDLSEDEWKDALTHLNTSAQICRESAEARRGRPPFVGLFGLSGRRRNQDYGGRDASKRAAEVAASLGGPSTSSVNHICVGSKYFARLEDSTEETSGPTELAWWVYELENMAFGCFIGNLLMWIDESHAAQNVYRLFPLDKSRGPKHGPFRVHG